uniref:Reverse transcriptase domain-containing protein n=1 Tax=Tanacetum cinerariifolium TaxID=118510 RepID=A0A699I7T8_TANCI|nr:hypothetical protein [Tanacetum cinerariifolium]
MMLLAKAITQHYYTLTNNRLLTSSNTRNQAVIQDGRVNIESKNVGYAGNGNRNAMRKNRNQEANVGNGHYTRDCPKHRVCDANYFREQMLLATKDEAEVHLDEEEMILCSTMLMEIIRCHENLTLYDHEGWDDPRDFAKPVKKEVGYETNNEPDKSVEEEITGDGIKELVETPKSRHIGYYLKHEITEKMIKGLIDNQIYNDSLLATRLCKMDYVTYNSLPEGPMYDAILKKKITKKEGSQLYIPHRFVILDVKEDKKKPYILGTPFLTTAKAKIRFDKGAITLKSGKNKINFFKILESLCRVEEGTKSDMDPATPNTTVSRVILEWEEIIKLHQEKEMSLTNEEVKCLTINVLHS